MIARELDLRGLVPLDSIRFEVDEEDIVRACESSLRRALTPIEDGLGRLERRLNRLEARLGVEGTSAPTPNVGHPCRAAFPLVGAAPAGGRLRSDIFLRIVDENLALRGCSGVLPSSLNKVAHRVSR